MDITNILADIGAFIGGGAFFSILTWKATVKGAEADAMAKVQAIYQQLTGDLVKEIERLKTEVELLRQEVNTLSHRAGAACYRTFCVSRIFEEEKQILELEQHEDNTPDPDLKPL